MSNLKSKNIYIITLKNCTWKRPKKCRDFSADVRNCDDLKFSSVSEDFGRHYFGRFRRSITVTNSWFQRVLGIQESSHIIILSIRSLTFRNSHIFWSQNDDYPPHYRNRGLSVRKSAGYPTYDGTCLSPRLQNVARGSTRCLVQPKSCTKLCSNLPYLVQSMIFSATNCVLEFARALSFCTVHQI